MLNEARTELSLTDDVTHQTKVLAFQEGAQAPATGKTTTNSVKLEDTTPLTTGNCTALVNSVPSVNVGGQSAVNCGNSVTASRWCHAQRGANGVNFDFDYQETASETTSGDPTITVVASPSNAWVNVNGNGVSSTSQVQVTLWVDTYIEDCSGSANTPCNPSAVSTGSWTGNVPVSSSIVVPMTWTNSNGNGVPGFTGAVPSNVFLGSLTEGADKPNLAAIYFTVTVNGSQLQDPDGNGFQFLPDVQAEGNSPSCNGEAGPFINEGSSGLKVPSN